MACASQKAVLRSTPTKGNVLLLKHGWDMPSVSWAASHSERLRTAPFDGVLLDSPLRDRIFSQQALTIDEIRSALEPYRQAGLGQGRHDLLLLFASSPQTDACPPDVFEDWSVIFDNLRLFSLAAKEAGLYGLAFDNEPYGCNWFAFDVVQNDRSIEDYARQYKARGEQTMAAIQAGWTDAPVLLFLGPWISVDETGAYREPWPYIGPFAAGMAMTAQVGQLIEGGERYALRLPEQFKLAAQQMRVQWPPSYPFLSKAELPLFLGKMPIAFGVYDRHFIGPEKGKPLTVEELRCKLNAVSQAGDGIVWLYTESADWWREAGEMSLPPVTEEMKRMIEELRQIFDGSPNTPGS